MNAHSLKLSRRGAIVGAALALSCGLAAAAWPSDNRPVKILVPWPTGGATDQVARMLSQPLSQALGVPVVVENKAGAGGVLGTQQFVKEKADGHTILLATSSTNAAAPHLYAKLGYDPVTDFTPVASDKRLPALPDVPTFKEAGTPMIASAWYGLMLPANAPADAVARLNAEVNKILRNPEINAKLTGMGAIVLGGTAQEFGRFSVAEIKRYEGIVRDSGAPKE